MNYGYSYSDSGAEAAVLVILVVYGVILLFALAVGLAFYVMSALSLHTIARRRGIRNPWLAWLPVGTEWIIGSISDQYQYVVKDKVRSRRKVLLGLSLATLVLSVMTIIRTVSMIVQLVMSDGMLSGYQSETLYVSMIVSVLLLSLVLSVAGIVMLVFKHICMYDLYRSCDPSNGVLYLVLGIVLSFLEPIFLLIVRKKDGGMPPRRDIQPERPPLQEQFAPDRTEPWDQ